MDPNAALEELREFCMSEDNYNDRHRMFDVFIGLDNWLRRKGAPPPAWQNSFTRKTRAETEVNTTSPGKLVHEMRGLATNGGVRANSEQFKALFRSLDVWLQDGGHPPTEWKGAFLE